MGEGQIKVLLVDDEEQFLSTTARVLSRRGCQITTAANGYEALDIVQNTSQDVVVLDVRMPGMDGIQVLGQVKKLDPLVEVIILTGHASLEVAIEGMRLGAFDYLMKPVDLDELLYKIEDAHKAKTIQEEKILRLEEDRTVKGSEE